ncbi:binuclear zinc transcription factor [Colletotrichum limetticola]|uniref:Binuclear zinc transcription factor n=1 Tax=Colletotrichum limetticola TaxID=1209924 RepID=A0ABQ9PAL6_9PEZI|nr:binuclear zinc transcription factor [Colletotrichum limetticola]
MQSQEGNDAPANQFSCTQCRTRKLSCDYPQSRRANVGRRKRVHELEAKLEQLERLAKTGDNPSASENDESPPQQIAGESADCLTGGLPYATTSTSGTPDQTQPPLNDKTSFTDLLSLGLFEQPPSQDVIEFLTRTYFEKWQYAAPMLHPTRYTMSLYLPPHMQPPMCLQYIVMASGAEVAKTHRQLAMPFYHRAKAYVEADEMRGDGQFFATVAHAQCWTLIANFEAQQLYFAQASMSLCRAIRIGQMLGLHRVDGEGVDAMSLLPPPQDWSEAEERRRTWWVIYCSDRLVGGSTGWPVMINQQDITTHLPASETAFETGVEEQTSPLTSILLQEGRGFSAFAGRVLAAASFFQAFQHSTRTLPDDDLTDLRTSRNWKRHREIDNDLVGLLAALPDDLTLPQNIQSRNATFVNAIIHTSVILLHRSALARIGSSGLPEHMAKQSQARLICAAEEILNIIRMMPDITHTLKNPIMNFSIYTASLVFLENWDTSAQDYRRQDNLDFILRIIILAAKVWNNPVTKSTAVQLAVDMRKRGLESEAVDKATEFSSGLDMEPIMAKGSSSSSNFVYQGKITDDAAHNMPD